MSWKEIERDHAVWEEAQRIQRVEKSRLESLELELTEQGANIIAEGILEEFGVAQALTDVKEGVWGEGSITQTRNKRGWVLMSDPITTLRRPYLGDYWSEKDRQVISLDQGSISLSIGVEFENRDPAEPILVTKDSSGTSILLREHHLNELRNNMQGILRSSGSKWLVTKIYTELGFNLDWSFTGSVGEVKDLGGENAPQRFKGSLISVVNSRIGEFSLPGQVRDSWSPIIDQFPRQHQLRKHGLTVGDLISWEREVRGPTILQRAGLLFSGKSRQPTKV